MLFEKIKLEDDEQVLLIVRRHWFVFFSRIIGVVGTALLPFLAYTFVASFSLTKQFVVPITHTYSNELLFCAALWLLMHWMTLAYLWTDQYLDLWVVTDRRIVSIDQRRLFTRSIGSFRLERLQDMNVEIPGFLATIFNYGNIEAQTASGSEEEFQVSGLPDPRDIKALILEAADNRMRKSSSIMSAETEQSGL